MIIGIRGELRIGVKFAADGRFERFYGGGFFHDFFQAILRNTAKDVFVEGRIQPWIESHDMIIWCDFFSSVYATIHVSSSG